MSDFDVTEINQALDDHLHGRAQYDEFALIRDAYAKIQVLEDENEKLRKKNADLGWAVSFHREHSEALEYRIQGFN